VTIAAAFFILNVYFPHFELFPYFYMQNIELAVLIFRKLPRRRFFFELLFLGKT